MPCSLEMRFHHVPITAARAIASFEALVPVKTDGGAKEKLVKADLKSVAWSPDGAYVCVGSEVCMLDS